MQKVTFIIPTRNNLPYLKLCYKSIKEFAPDHNIIILDDGSTDGTDAWIATLNDEKIQYSYHSNQLNPSECIGHTILYNRGFNKLKNDNDIGCILHSDMIIGPNFVENLFKHYAPRSIISATRVEPPLHPIGAEKLTENFGIYPDEFKKKEFDEYCIKCQIEFKNISISSFFAPWIISKHDYQAIGGTDELFAPYPREDDDFALRCILARYKMIMSCDSFCYHFTCRGHRWTSVVGKNHDKFEYYQTRSSRNFIRKWGSNLELDKYRKPIVQHKYNIGYEVINCTINLLKILEPWCNNINIDNKKLIDQYIKEEQPETKFDLFNKIHYISEYILNNDIIVKINGEQLIQSDFDDLIQIPKLISQINQTGIFKLGSMNLTIKNLNIYEKSLIYCKNE